MWNIKNPEEFQSQNNGQGPYVPPEVEEIGPYSYIESYEKTNIHYENGAYENSSWIGYKLVVFLRVHRTPNKSCSPFDCSGCSKCSVLRNFFEKLTNSPKLGPLQSEHRIVQKAHLERTVWTVRTPNKPWTPEILKITNTKNIYCSDFGGIWLYYSNIIYAA